MPPPEENDAHWLLDFYASFMDYQGEDMAQNALRCLSQIEVRTSQHVSLIDGVSLMTNQ